MKPNYTQEERRWQSWPLASGGPGLSQHPGVVGGGQVFLSLVFEALAGSFIVFYKCPLCAREGGCFYQPQPSFRGKRQAPILGT